MLTERRYGTISIEDRAEGLPKIQGTASPTYDGTAGSEYKLYEDTYERFMPGAFDTHLTEQPTVMALFNHDVNQVLGRTPNTLKLNTDSRGLHYEITPADTTLARDVVANIKAGNLVGSSFEFVPTAIRWTRDGSKSIREIVTAKVYDVSVVTNAAYKSSSATVRTKESLEEEKHNALETERIMARMAEIEKTLTR